MELNVIKRTAVEASEMVKGWEQRYRISFAPSFNVTGGEPLLRKDLFEILSLFASLGWAASLLTNGTLIDEEKARRLADLVDGVQVSIEGPETVHEAIRGKGSFRAATDGIERLLKYKVPVTLNVTLSRLNVNYLPDIIDLGREMGVRRIGFSRLVPRGRGKGLRQSMIESRRLEGVYRSILGLGDAALEINTGDPIAGLIDSKNADDKGDVAFGGCAAGMSGLTLLPDGTLTPCRRLPIPIGNVQREPIRRVWAASPVLNRLRDRKSYTGRCRYCPHWAICRGCRAIAYADQAMTGGEDYLNDDPQCFISLS
jgi:radical SAM protein with 4Fe4S-binding SPASM domain